MTIQEVEQEISNLAEQHRKESEDEFAFLYEINAYELIVKYLVSKNIQLGNYDLAGLSENKEEYEFEKEELHADIQESVLADPPAFIVHPDALRLYTYHKNAFWPDMEE